MKVVIIEEQEKFARYLEQTMGMHEGFNRIDTFPDFFEFVQNFKKCEQPDLLLLDVFQLNGKALRLMQSYNITAPLLFTNSLKSCTPENFPSDERVIENFITANNELLVNVQKAGRVNNATETRPLPVPVANVSRGLSSSAKSHQRFLVKSKEKLISLRTGDIALFYSEGRLNFIKTKDNRKYIVNHSMEVLTSLLDPEHFFRINRSMIISFDDIKDMFSFFGGRVKIVLNTPVDKDIIVSRDKVTDFKKWLGE